MKSSMSAALAWGGLLGAGALWGGGALVAEALMGAGLSAQGLAFARFALGLPLLWWWHWRTPARPAWRDLSRRERALVLGTGLAMAASVNCWFMGIAALGPALPTVIAICGAPLIVAAVAVWRGYERASRALGVALPLALAGVVLLVWPSGGGVAGHAAALQRAAGLAWSLGAAALQAAVVLGNARMPARVPSTSASAWGMTAAAVGMGLVVLVQAAGLSGAGPQGLGWPATALGWLGVAYTGVVTTSVAYLLFARGARRLGPTAAALGILVEPLVAALLAAWLLAQPMMARQWAGAALLCGAVGLVVLRGRGR